ncbi:MAG: hypothetical protein K5695_07020 [Oscillospiraceae bacterium]|nr:hypothetical protein [Oscillospiraceae bacterium]
MNYRVKGYAASAALGIIVVAGVSLVVGAVIGAAGMYAYMKAHEGGLGEGEELAPFEEMVETGEEVPSELLTEPTTEPMTMPATEEITSVEIIVAEDGYLYNNRPVTLDGILVVLQSMKPDMSVKVTNQNASRHAYQALLRLLEEQEKPYIEAKK